MKKVEIIKDIVNNEKVIFYKFTFNRTEEILKSISSFSFPRKNVSILEDEILVTLEVEKYRKKIKELFNVYIPSKNKVKELNFGFFIKNQKGIKGEIEEEHHVKEEKYERRLNNEEEIKIIKKLLTITYEEEKVLEYLNLIDNITLDKINSILSLLERDKDEVELNETLRTFFEKQKIDYKKIYSIKQLKLYNSLNLEKLEKEEILFLLNPLIKIEFPIINLLYENIIEQDKVINFEQLVLIFYKNFNHYIGLKNSIDSVKDKKREEQNEV